MMLIKPRVRGFMCTTAHPVGCDVNVKSQIDYVKNHGNIKSGPKKVLVVGASTGYGLASRITAAFGSGADTLGLFFERAGSENKPGTPGWYNSAAFHKYAKNTGMYAKSINGDAFSDKLKRMTIDTIKRDFGQVDLVVYSVASPRRQHPKTGIIHNSILKPIGKDMIQQGVDVDKGVIKEFSIVAANQEEIDNTVAVMGGEDWQMWIEALYDAGVLASGCKTTAFTYVGEAVTRDIYWDGTIGHAKKDLDKRVMDIRNTMNAVNGDARVSVLKAVVTQASAAIPVMPLYLGFLFKVMKQEGSHEGCIEQIHRLFRESLYGANPYQDDTGRLRADYKEVAPHIQQS
jgi:enoyl-[acyl-carrier protein] reductase/trans-2-enoyl-CoA reductase (NAD+)